MPVRFAIRLDDDVEGHMPYRHAEDLSGQEVTIRMGDGTEVHGHGWKFPEDQRGDDIEGSGRYYGIELEVDDTEANLLTAASDRGEPIHVRFPDGAEVRGHPFYKFREDTTGEDTEGHRRIR
jgi:hypothetical protein